MSIKPKLEVGPREPLPHLYWTFNWVDLVQVTEVHDLIALSVQHFTALLPSSGSYTLINPSSVMFPEPWGKGQVDMGVPSMVDH